MIEGLIEQITARVVAPQALIPAPEPGEVDRRAWADADSSPINVQLAELDVVGLTTTPVRPEIGGRIINLRHVVAVVLTVEDIALHLAEQRRGLIVTDLLRRALLIEWPNIPIADDQDVQNVEVVVEYVPLEDDTSNAYATLTFTVDTEWSL